MGRRKYRCKGSNLRSGTSKSDPVSIKSTIGGETEAVGNKDNDGPKQTVTTIDDARWKKEIQVAEGPIGVHSRLSYPLVQSCSLNNSSWSEGEDEDETEERVELNIRPRFVFVSCLCAICSEKSKLFCERCRMVTYCSKKHRTLGLSTHRELCEPLNEIRSSIASTLSHESAAQFGPEQYRVYRLQLLSILELKIGRTLEFWEKEIVLYPRVCRVCRRFCDDEQTMTCCSHCGMESFCEAHEQEHKSWCEQFRILQRCLLLQHRHGCVHPKIPNFRERIAVTLPDHDFDRLMHRIYGNSTYYREMDCYTYSMLSHLATIPLTTLYSMQTACPEWEDKTEWTVHVIGAEFQFEGINLHVWEKLFLHFLPNLKTLRLILVGPELQLPKGVPAKLLSTFKLCGDCRSAGKSVVVSFKPGQLYHELPRNAGERLVEPDFICAFNPGLYRKTGYAGRDTWLETIREFCRKSTPVTVTSYTADEMVWEMLRISSVTDVEVILEPRQNPFASIKPDRNFVSDDTNPLIYKNYYIAIVKGKPILP